MTYKTFQTRLNNIEEKKEALNREMFALLAQYEAELTLRHVKEQELTI